MPNPQYDRPRVFVSRRLPEVGLKAIRGACEATVWPSRMPPNREELIRSVKGCMGIVSLLSDRIDGEVMEAAGPNLRVISNYAVGVNNIDLAEAVRRGISVGNTPGVLTDATADMAVGLLIAAARCIRPAAEEVRRGAWKTWEPTGWLGCDIAGRTLGIIGMGRIGQAFATRMAMGWNMNILYTSRTQKELHGVPFSTWVSLEELLSASDFVSIHVDLNDETRGLIGRRELGLMKPTAILVNTSRGEIIDQDALADALACGKLFAAGLDVTTPEPINPDHPLVGMYNCVITPHIASATVRSRDMMAEICAHNLIAGVFGEPLRAAVC